MYGDVWGATSSLAATAARSGSIWSAARSARLSGTWSASRSRAPPSRDCRARLPRLLPPVRTGCHELGLRAARRHPRAAHGPLPRAAGRRAPRGPDGVLLIAVATLTALTFAGSRGTVYLERADAIGSRAPFIPRNGSPGVAQRPVPVAATELLGDAPGLYGGSHTDACDARGIAIHLGAHPDKAGCGHKPWASTPSRSAPSSRASRRWPSAPTSPSRTTVSRTGSPRRSNPSCRPEPRYSSTPPDCPGPLLLREPAPAPAAARRRALRGPRVAGVAEKATVVRDAPAPVAEFVIVVDSGDEVRTRPRGSAGDRDQVADPGGAVERPGGRQRRVWHPAAVPVIASMVATVCGPAPGAGPVPLTANRRGVSRVGPPPPTWARRAPPPVG